MEIGDKIILKYNGKRGVPKWLDSFAAYIVSIKKSGKIEVSVPVDDDRIHIITKEQIES